MIVPSYISSPWSNGSTGSDSQAPSLAEVRSSRNNRLNNSNNNVIKFAVITNKLDYLLYQTSGFVKNYEVVSQKVKAEAERLESIGKINADDLRSICEDLDAQWSAIQRELGSKLENDAKYPERPEFKELYRSGQASLSHVDWTDIEELNFNDHHVSNFMKIISSLNTPFWP